MTKKEMYTKKEMRELLKKYQTIKEAKKVSGLNEYQFNKLLMMYNLRRSIDKTAVNKFKKVPDEKIIKMRKKLKAWEIANKYEVSVPTVYKRLKKIRGN